MALDAPKLSRTRVTWRSTCPSASWLQELRKRCTRCIASHARPAGDLALQCMRYGCSWHSSPRISRCLPSCEEASALCWTKLCAPRGSETLRTESASLRDARHHAERDCIAVCKNIDQDEAKTRDALEPSSFSKGRSQLKSASSTDDHRPNGLGWRPRHGISKPNGWTAHCQRRSTVPSYQSE